MKNKKYNQKKRMSYETIKTLAALKDVNLFANLFVALNLLLLVIGLFVGATVLDAQFAYVNNQAQQQITGAIYSYIPLQTSISFGSYVFGIANKEMGVVYDISMMFGFILAFVGLVLAFIPLKGEIKKYNKYKYLICGGLLVIGTILTFVSLIDLQVTFDELLYDMITYGKYDANKSETKAYTSVYSYILFVVSLLTTAVLVLKSLIESYRAKNDANY